MIYVVSKGNFVTGGPETLHQLCGLLVSMGYDAKMHYVSPGTKAVPEPYKKYNVASAALIEDAGDNILIVPESLTHIIRRYKRIRICIWWLSLDNYLDKDPVYLVSWRMQVNHWPKILFPLAFLVLAAKGKIHFGRYEFDDNGRYFHAYNCEYAHRYIVEHGVPDERTIYLCGPLNRAFFNKAEKLSAKEANERENIILYNPKKGSEFTKKIIKAAIEENLDAQFIAIQGMTPDQVSDLMSRAKVYMDFGSFPGPERIPREAVTMRCNIITSRNGSAANEVDVPIPDELKYEDIDGNIGAIIERLQDMLNDYDRYVPLYDSYREKVFGQVGLLRENAKQLIDNV